MDKLMHLLIAPKDYQKQIKLQLRPCLLHVNLTHLHCSNYPFKSKSCFQFIFSKYSVNFHSLEFTRTQEHC